MQEVGMSWHLQDSGSGTQATGWWGQRGGVMSQPEIKYGLFPPTASDRLGKAQNQTQNASVLEFGNAHGGLGPADRQKYNSVSAFKEERV